MGVTKAAVNKAADYADVGEDMLFFGIGTALVFGAVGTTAWFVGKKVKDIREGNAYDRVAGKDRDGYSPAQTAVKLRMAFENCEQTKIWTMGTVCFGTDEEAVFAALKEVPSLKAWDSVEKEYSRITRGRVLMEDLKSELEDGYGDYDRAMSIINSKPQK